MMLTQTVASFTTPHGYPCRFIYRENTSDWNTCNSITTADEYSLPIGLSGVAVDVGAHIGVVTVVLALDNPELRVIAIEPVPGNVDLIRENVALNGVGNRVTIIAGAAGGTDPVTVWYGFKGSESLEHHAFIGNSTLTREVPVYEHEEITYPATSLVDLLVQEGEIDYLKIDCEGGEWAFLDSPWIDRVRTVVGEWHPTDGHTVGDILDLLDTTHYVTTTGPVGGPGGFTAVRR